MGSVVPMQGPINMISTGLMGAILNSILTKNYMDFSVSSLDSSSRTTWA